MTDFHIIFPIIAGDILLERKENILINFMSDSLRKQKTGDLRPAQRTQLLNLMIWGICK